MRRNGGASWDLRAFCGLRRLRGLTHRHDAENDSSRRQVLVRDALHIGRGDGKRLLVLRAEVTRIAVNGGAVRELERALCAYRGALLVISHDLGFLDALSLTRRLRLEDGHLRQA